MPEADAEVDILIKTLADKYGIEEVQKGLDGLKDTVKESDQAVQKHNVSGREMRRLFRDLNQVAPGLGSVLRVAFSPQNLGIGAAIVSLHEFIRIIRQAQKEALEAAAEQTAAAGDMFHKTTKAIEDMSTAAGIAADNIAHSFQALKDAQDTSEKHIASITTAIDTERSAIERLLKAEEQLALSGAKTDDERREIKTRFGDRESSINLDAERAKITQQERALDRARGATPGLEEDATRLRVTSDESIKQKAQADADLAASVKRVDELQKEMAKSQQFRMFGGKDEDQVRAELAAAEQKEKLNVERVGALEREASAAKARAADAEKRLEENRKFLVEGSSAVDSARGKYGVGIATQTNVQAIEHATELNDKMHSAIKQLGESNKRADFNSFLESVLKISALPAQMVQAQISLQASDKLMIDAFKSLNNRVGIMEKQIKSTVH